MAVQKISNLADYNALLAASKSESKLVVLDFSAAWYVRWRSFVVFCVYDSSCQDPRRRTG